MKAGRHAVASQREGPRSSGNRNSKFATSASVDGCFSTRHCEKLASHPECNATSLTQQQLGHAPTTAITLTIKQYSVDGTILGLKITENLYENFVSFINRYFLKVQCHCLQMNTTNSVKR